MADDRKDIIYYNVTVEHFSHHKAEIPLKTDTTKRS